MKLPDFNQASAYARTRLERELPSTLYYHSLMHTRDDVVLATERLAAITGIVGEELLLLRTAAWYHDIGFVERRADHEAAGARIAAEVLPHFGYSEAQIQTITGLIMATRLPQTPCTFLEQIMADADLDSLGRKDFLTTSLALRVELALDGAPTTEAEWFMRQIHFLKSHRYFTAAASALRDTQKQWNIGLLTMLLQIQGGRDGRQDGD